MVVLALWVLLAGIFRLDPESMGTEVVSLSLQQVRREVFGAISIVEAQSCAESWCGNTPERTLADDIPPSWLSLVDGFVEEVVEEQVLEFWVVSVCTSDILEEDRSDDTSTTPHKRN